MHVLFDLIEYSKLLPIILLQFFICIDIETKPILMILNQVQIFQCNSSIPFLIIRLPIIRRPLQIIPHINLKRGRKEIIHHHKIIPLRTINLLQFVQSIHPHQKRLRILNQELMIVGETLPKRIVLFL